MRLCYILFLTTTVSGFYLPTIFQDGMVLQSGHSTIWGFTEGNPGAIFANTKCVMKDGVEIEVTFTPEKQDKEFFEFNFAFEEGTKCDFTFTQDNQEVPSLWILEDVLFGDVWICSGQSNMKWPLEGIFNGTQEIADLAEYKNFRLFHLPEMASNGKQNDLLIKDVKWTSTSDAESLKSFSAVCSLTAKYMANVLGQDKVFGLIDTNWGGTRVEAWMPPEAFESCGISNNYVDKNRPQNSYSSLYNAMIHPLTKLNIKGVLWYQGEANAWWKKDDYACNFPSMIESWRNIWSESTKTSSKFPFGFMQLGTQKKVNRNQLFPQMRWHQTAHFGYVPNDFMQDVFMGVSLDTFDKVGGIHPRNKQLPSFRLATAGLNVAYGLEEYPNSGPNPTKVVFNPSEDEIQVEVLYDQDFIWDDSETNGFSYCCAADVKLCDVGKGKWKDVPNVEVNGREISARIPSCSVGFAYLWKSAPVLGTEALPIYADNEFKLPAAPWIWSVIMT